VDAERRFPAVVFGLALVAIATAGCANQKDVIPMLHVEPTAAARMAYFEKRNAALIAESPDAPEAPEAPDDSSVAASDGAEACIPPAIRTWGAPSSGSADAPQGKSCDPGGND